MATSQELVEKAYNIGLLFSQAAEAGFMKYPDADQQQILRNAIALFHNGIVRTTHLAKELLGDQTSDALLAGLLLEQCVEELTEYDLMQKREFPLDEVVLQTASLFKKHVEEIKNNSPEIKSLIDEMFYLCRMEEDMDSPDYDDFSSEEALSKASLGYRQLRVIRSIQEMIKAYEYESGEADNEYQYEEMDHWSFSVYTDEFFASQPLDKAINDKFAEVFNELNASYGYLQRMVLDDKGEYHLKNDAIELIQQNKSPKIL